MKAAAAVLIVALFVLRASAQSEGECTWLGLGYDPWLRFNVISFGNIGSSGAPYGADFEGRAAAGGSMWFHSFSLHDIQPNIDTYPFSAVAGAGFSLNGGSVHNGGVEAGGPILLQSANVEGNVHSLGNADIGLNPAQSVTVNGHAHCLIPGNCAKGSSSTVSGGLQNVASLSLGVDLVALFDYFTIESGTYRDMPSTEGSGTTVINQVNVNTDIQIVLAPGINIVNSLTWNDIAQATRLLLTNNGDDTARVVINVAGLTGPNLDSIDVYLNGVLLATLSAHVAGVTKYGKVLFNFHEATEMQWESPSAFSVLAPYADFTYKSGVIWGNLVVKSLRDVYGDSSQVNFLPWAAECPQQPPSPAPSPGTTGEVPSPPECPGCPWDEPLGYNPWEHWGVFSLSDIGTSTLNFGADFQGRVGAVGNVWFKAFHIHDVVGPITNAAYSASVGGSFYLNGGSVFNGGVEAGDSFQIKAADVNGDVVAVTGTGKLGEVNTDQVWINGGAFACLTINKQPQSYVKNGVHQNLCATQTLSLTMDLDAAATFFRFTSYEYSLHASTVTPVFSADIMLVTLQAGFNYVTLSWTKVQSLSRVRISGDPTGVLVINIPDNVAGMKLDSLDIFVGNFKTLPSFGRVLLNYYAAENLVVDFGSGYFSLMAPLANVTFKAGMFTGTWVVGNLTSQWAGGTQINWLPWQPPCPVCEEPVEPLAPVLTLSGRNFVAQEVDQEIFESGASKSTQVVPQWALIAGGSIAGVALSALIVAAIAIKKVAARFDNGKASKNGRKASSLAAQSPFNAVMSPRSETSSMSQRGGRGPMSP